MFLIRFGKHKQQQRTKNCSETIHSSSVSAQDQTKGHSWTNMRSADEWWWWCGALLTLINVFLLFCSFFIHLLLLFLFSSELTDEMAMPMVRHTFETNVLRILEALLFWAGNWFRFARNASTDYYCWLCTQYEKFFQMTWNMRNLYHL